MKPSELSLSNEWKVQARIFQVWNRLYRFTIDGAAARWNAQLPKYVTKRQNAFKFDFTGQRVWTNPPYSRGNLDRWMALAWRWIVDPGDAQLWALHVPAYTSEGWWTRHIARSFGTAWGVGVLEIPGFANGYRRQYDNLTIDVWFYEGRLRHTEQNGASGSARHASALVVFGDPAQMPALTPTPASELF